MLGHIWDWTLRACHSVKVPEKTLTPEPKMQYFPAQQAAHRSLSVLFPLAHRASLREVVRVSKRLPNATHQSPPPQTVYSAASILRAWRSAQGLAHHSRQQFLLPSPLTKARLEEGGAKGPNEFNPLTYTRKRAKI